MWNAAERAEDKSTRWASATGRDIILALPHELTHEQRVAAVREFGAALVKRYGVAVDFAIHAPDRHGDARNYHAHLLTTTRRIGPNGFGPKTRELDDFKTGPREIEAIRLLVGANRQSRFRTCWDRPPHRLPQVCRPGDRSRGDGSSGAGTSRRCWPLPFR